MTSDHFAVRVVIVALATSALVGVAVMGYLNIRQVPVQDPFDRLVTFLAGALAGVLAKTSTGPTEVIAPPGEAVAVEEIDPNPEPAP